MILGVIFHVDLENETADIWKVGRGASSVNYTFRKLEVVFIYRPELGVSSPNIIKQLKLQSTALHQSQESDNL